MSARPAFDVTNCEREPIHAPGAVQPHGLFLAIDPRNGLPCAASENLAAATGVPQRALLGAQGLSIFETQTRARLLEMVRGRLPPRCLGTRDRAR